MRFIAGLLCAMLLWQGEPARAADGEAAPVIPAAWLVEKISVEAAETEHPGLSDERVERFPEAAKPFGFQNGEWEVPESVNETGGRDLVLLVAGGLLEKPCRPRRGRAGAGRRPDQNGRHRSELKRFLTQLLEMVGATGIEPVTPPV